MAYQPSPAYSAVPQISYLRQHSGLEQIVHYEPTFSYARQMPYSFSAFSAPLYITSAKNNPYKRQDYDAQQPETTTMIMHESFLNPLRPAVQFINDVHQIRGHVEAAFKATTGEDLPKDFTVEVLPEKEFRKIKPEGVLGFAVNRKPGKSSIAVMENELDMMMVVVGHEIGHVLTLPASSPQDEEAKAFAFQFAWTKAIFENNIAGLKRSINAEIFRPAQNGVHDVAFSLVQKLTASGRKALEVYGLIASGLIGTRNWQIIDF